VDWKFCVEGVVGGFLSATAVGGAKDIAVPIAANLLGKKASAGREESTPVVPKAVRETNCDRSVIARRNHKNRMGLKKP
jgi:hypothetical protein